MEIARRLPEGRLELFDLQPEMLDEAARTLDGAGLQNVGFQRRHVRQGAANLRRAQHRALEAAPEVVLSQRDPDTMFDFAPAGPFDAYNWPINGKLYDPP